MQLFSLLTMQPEQTFILSLSLSHLLFSIDYKNKIPNERLNDEGRMRKENIFMLALLCSHRNLFFFFACME
jgi:hypothetical protein